MEDLFRNEPFFQIKGILRFKHTLEVCISFSAKIYKREKASLTLLLAFKIIAGICT